MLLVLLVVMPVAAPAAPAGWSQGASSRATYTASQLDCARFRETSRADIRTYIGGRSRDASTGREGIWAFRATPAGRGTRLEGWLDSLAVWRAVGGNRVDPDTDGLLGGRYGGLLTSDGRYRPVVRPFVPDEVADVMQMAAVLDDFFPRMPPGRLQPGGAWTDSSGLQIRRVSDSLSAGIRLLRFRITARREESQEMFSEDTLPFEVRQILEERADVVWHPGQGLLQEDRHISVETRVPANERVGRPVRSKVEQRIVLIRLRPLQPSDSAACRQT